jgi:hypothetical protein
MVDSGITALFGSTDFGAFMDSDEICDLDKAFRVDDYLVDDISS